MTKPDQKSLTIKRHWLNEIISGRKVEEYREDKTYYLNLWPKIDQDTACIIGHAKTYLFRNGYLKTKPFTIKEKNGIFFESPIDKSKPYVIVEIEKIRFESLQGLTKPIPEGMIKGTRVYSMYIKQILEYNIPEK